MMMQSPAVMKPALSNLKSPFLQSSCLPLGKNIVFLRKNRPLRISLSFKKPPPAEVAGRLLQNAGLNLFEAVKTLMTHVDTAIPREALQVAMYGTLTAVIGWAFKAILSKIKDPLHFEVDDLVEYQSKDVVVLYIGASTILLSGEHGPQSVENTAAGQSLITNLTRKVPSVGGVCKLLTFHVEFDVERNQKEICNILKDYMKSNKYLKDQMLYNLVTTPGNKKIQVVGFVKCADVTAPQFATYQLIKTEIVAELRRLVDENKPIILCDMCQTKIKNAAAVMTLIAKAMIFAVLVQERRIMDDLQ